MNTNKKLVRVICKLNCGNSPNKMLLRDFNFSVARGDLSSAGKSLLDDVVWNLFEPAGQKRLIGKENVLKEYKDNLVIVPAEFVIDTILTQDDAGIVSGTVKAQDGKKFVFCDVYKFSSHTKKAYIKEITSYIIQKKVK